MLGQHGADHRQLVFAVRGKLDRQRLAGDANIGCTDLLKRAPETAAGGAPPSRRFAWCKTLL